MRPSVRFILISSLLLISGIFGRSALASGTPTKITISPSPLTLAAGQTQTMTVTAIAADDSTTDVTTQATLSSDDPRGTFAGAVFTSGKTGTWTIQATYQSLTVTSTVTVTPGAVQELVINPNSDPEPTIMGKNMTFSATAYDGFSNSILNQPVVWSVIGDIGTITDHGIFTPKQLGTGKVQAMAGAITGQVSVVVQAAPVVNTNTVKNTNATVNQNANSSNANTAITNLAPATSTTDTCTTLKPWAWTLMLVVFMLVVVVFYALIPVTKIWPVVIALVAAATLAYIQRTYACGGQQWWAWVMTLGTIAISAIANQLTPKSEPIT